jgi:hypothetical protein
MARFCHILIILLLFWAGVDAQVVGAALDGWPDDASTSQDDEYLPSRSPTALEDSTDGGAGLPVDAHTGLAGRARPALVVAARQAVRCLIPPSGDPIFLLMSLQR